MSLEQIVGRRKKAGKETMSIEWMYLFIYKDKKKGGVLYKNLKRSHKNRRKRLNRNDNRGIIADR